jgi:DNA modification methylase
MVEDAIMDCSNRGDAVLDAFCGSGTTLIAAERVGRRGFGLEIDPKYVDATLRRFRALTGEEPVRLDDGSMFKSLE